MLRVSLPEPIQRRARKRAPLAALALAALWAATAAPDAGAHAVVQPAASRPAEQQVYTLTVPSERGSDVIEVSMQVPPAVESLLVRKAPGWQVRIQREGDRVAVVRWSGSRIPPQQYDSFQFIARNPVQEGELDWKVIQKYTNATDRWIGPPDSEYPAARTRISESATPVDAINTEEGTPAADGAGADAGQAPTADGGGGGDGDSNTVPIVLGAAALVAALAALGLALSNRRRHSPT
jgi:uncharacterized protein YcnI